MDIPPPVANATANASLDAASAGPAPDPRTRAGKAAKRFKASSDWHELGLVTTPEHGDQYVHATTVALAAAMGMPDDAPAWAVALAHQVNTLNARFDDIDARLRNAPAMEKDDQIIPLKNDQGELPPAAIFPNTFGDLLLLGDDDAHTLLLHYQIPVDPEETRNIRLRRFLGVRW